MQYVVTNSLMADRLVLRPDTGAPGLYENLERYGIKVAEFHPGGSPAPVGYENYEFWIGSCDHQMTGPLIKIYKLSPVRMEQR